MNTMAKFVDFLSTLSSRSMFYYGANLNILLTL